MIVRYDHFNNTQGHCFDFVIFQAYSPVALANLTLIV